MIPMECMHLHNCACILIQYELSGLSETLLELAASFLITSAYSCRESPCCFFKSFCRRPKARSLSSFSSMSDVNSSIWAISEDSRFFLISVSSCWKCSIFACCSAILFLIEAILRSRSWIIWLRSSFSIVAYCVVSIL